MDEDDENSSEDTDEGLCDEELLADDVDCDEVDELEDAETDELDIE